MAIKQQDTSLRQTALELLIKKDHLVAESSEETL